MTVTINGRAPSLSQAAEFRQAFNVASRDPKGCVQSISMLGTAGTAASAAYSFTNSLYVDGDFYAARFCYSNMGTSTPTIAAAKCAASPTLMNNGLDLAYANITFDGAASGRRDTTYNGVAGSTTTAVLPARVSGSGANIIPSKTWSDWVPLASVPCTDAGFEDLRVLQHRTYISSTSFVIMHSGSVASNWGNYNANSRRKNFSAANAGDQVTTITSQPPGPNWQWMPVTEVQVLLRKPVWNHGVFGDSISKGQGSFDNNNGLWGWAHRAVQGLTDLGAGVHSLVNAAVSGQNKTATWNIAMQSIQSGGLDTATMFPWSPNDGQATVGDFAWQIRAFVGECRKYGTTPILCTSVPAGQITDPVWDAVRKSVNEDIRAMAAHGAIICDFDAAVSNGAAVARFLPGLSGDNVHPSDAGHAVMAEVYRSALLAATSTTIPA